MAEPVRIFIGCDPNDCDLEQLLVLHHSLRKYSSRPLDIAVLRLSPDPESFWFSESARQLGWNTRSWATPFSGLRWGIPAFCGFQGRAIYMDADIVALSDIAELWDMKIPEGKVMLASGRGRNLRLGTLMWDCAAAARVLPPVQALRRHPGSHARMVEFFQAMPEIVQPLEPAFSNLDGDGLPLSALKLLHYSDMGTQFSHRHALPRLRAEGQRHWFDGKILPHPRRDLAAIFDATLAEALAAGGCLDDHRAPRRFGALPKKSERWHRGNPTTRSIFGLLRRPPAAPVLAAGAMALPSGGDSDSRFRSYEQ